MYLSFILYFSVFRLYLPFVCLCLPFVFVSSFCVFVSSFCVWVLILCVCAFLSCVCVFLLCVCVFLLCVCVFLLCVCVFLLCLGRDALTLGWEEEGSRVVGWAPGSRHTVPRPVIGHQARSSLESRHRPILDTHLTYSTRGWPGDTPPPRFTTTESTYSTEGHIRKSWPDQNGDHNRLPCSEHTNSFIQHFRY